MMRRGSTNQHMPNQDCSNCGQLGHPWFTFPCIICNGCNQCDHIYRHCWDRIPPSGTASPPKGHHNNGRQPSHPQYSRNQRDDRRSCSRSNVRPHPRDRSVSHSRHPSTDRHTSRDRNPRRRHTLDHNQAQSQSPHRQQSRSNRPLTPYTRNSSRSRSSSCSNEKPPRCSVTIQDNHEDHEDQDYNNTDDYFEEDLN